MNALEIKKKIHCVSIRVQSLAPKAQWFSLHVQKTSFCSFRGTFEYALTQNPRNHSNVLNLGGYPDYKDTICQYKNSELEVPESIYI